MKLSLAGNIRIMLFVAESRKIRTASKTVWNVGERAARQQFYRRGFHLILEGRISKIICYSPQIFHVRIFHLSLLFVDTVRL